MNNFNRISASAFLAAASLAVSPDSWALGLGDAKVESFLNQPLRARIDLVTQETDDMASVTARLASAADYEMIGASRESVSVPIHFTIEDVDGDAYILATSRLPVGDPVVRLIVEVNWSSGRMLREYTLFLDPPTVPDTPPAPRIDERPEARPAAQPAAATPVEAPTAAPAARPATATQAQMPAGGEQYGPVKRGETLWGIASNWSRGSGMDVNRVMIAIQRANPSAFLNNNINLLKRGAILRMPESEEVNGISSQTAFSEVRSQEEEFEGRKTSGAAASAETPLLAEESAAPVAADVTDAASPLTPAEEPELPAAEVAPDTETAESGEPEAGHDQLELVPPSEESVNDSTYGFEESEETGTAGDSVQALREDLARTEEELYNQKQQNSYLEDRIKELESQLESAEQGNVADSDAANMEQRLREERQVDQQERERLAASSPAEEPEKPWYSRFGLWLIGLLVVIAALAGWIISRRGYASGAEAAAASRSDSLRDIQDEAEQVLRVLEEPESEPESESEAEVETETGEEQQADAEAPETEQEQDEERGEPAPEEAKPGKRTAQRGEDDAELLDEESSDPEIQLDLARAYISMGDKEAARVILEEVLSNGSEEQQEDARKMLDVLKA